MHHITGAGTSKYYSTYEYILCCLDDICEFLNTNDLAKVIEHINLKLKISLIVPSTVKITHRILRAGNW